MHALKLGVVALKFSWFCNSNMRLLKKSIFFLCLWVKEETVAIYIDFYSSAVCFGPAKPGASVSIWALSNIFSRGSGCGKATEANRRECVNGYMCVCVWETIPWGSLSAHTDSVPSPAVSPDPHILTVAFLHSGAWRQPCSAPAPIAKHRRGSGGISLLCETNRPSK